MHPSDIAALVVLGVFALLGATRWLRVLWGIVLGVVAGAVLLGLAGLALQWTGGTPAEFIAAGRLVPCLTGHVEQALEVAQRRLEDGTPGGPLPDSDPRSGWTDVSGGRPTAGSSDQHRHDS